MKLLRDLYRALDQASALSPDLRRRTQRAMRDTDEPSPPREPATHEEGTVSLAGARTIIDAVADEVTVLLLGPPGIGKSALAAQVAESRGLRLSTLQGPMLAPEDLLGLPIADMAAPIDARRVRYAPPEMIIPGDGQPVLLLVDELASAPRDVQRALHELLLDRRVGTHLLPAGSVIIAASNRVEDGAFALNLSTALINRLVVLHVTAAFEEWMEWAEGAQVRPEILAFLRFRPEALLRKPSEEQALPLSTPRAWTTLSRSLDRLDARRVCVSSLRRAVVDGTVSAVDAADFCECVDARLIDAGSPRRVIERPSTLPREGAARWVVLYGIRAAVARRDLGRFEQEQLDRFFSALSPEEKSVVVESLVDAWVGVGALDSLRRILKDMLS